MPNTIEGYELVRNAIKRLPKETRKNFIRVVRSLSNELKQEILGRTPVRTGVLARSIRIKIKAGGLSADIGQVRNADYKTLAFYGRFVEYGTKAYNVGDKTSGRHTVRRSIPARPARPFIRPAAERLLPDLAERLDKALTETLETT